MKLYINFIFPNYILFYDLTIQKNKTNENYNNTLQIFEKY
jgi:hypothetical protein